MVKSIFSRKRDLIYLVFFLIHIPVLFCVDLVALYPPDMTPQPLLDLRQFYITTYQDRFFTEPPAWFRMYIWLEAFYHVPISFWAVGALLRNDPKVPLQLLIYAMQTAVTTATCIADYLSWEGVSGEVKWELAKLYVPYLGVSVFMGVDMYSRLDKVLGKRAVDGGKKGN